MIFARWSGPALDLSGRNISWKVPPYMVRIYAESVSAGMGSLMLFGWRLTAHSKADDAVNVGCFPAVLDLAI